MVSHNKLMREDHFSKEKFNKKPDEDTLFPGSIEGDTIVAISTSLAPAGIGIVRLSGKDAFDFAEKVFRPISGKKYRAEDNRKLRYGHIIDGDRVIDEVLVSFMKAPYTYTGENIVEVNCHGGPLSVKRILELFLDMGLRPAGPGEFTRRAFLNGRIDLAQAEAVEDIIEAPTTRAQDQALKQLSGDLSNKVSEIKRMLLDLLASVEYSINFMEDSMEEPPTLPMLNKALAIEEKMNTMLESSKTGRIIREGIATVIVGKPNVGKSSLLNAILKDERAIVTDIPGTTRDSIEESISMDGISLRLIDTAGIRETDDPIESVGVERAKKLVMGCDLALVLIDGSSPLDAEDREIVDLVEGIKSIIVINKKDLKEDPSVGQFIKEIREKALSQVKISAKNSDGLKDLEEEIKKLFFNEKSPEFSGDYAMMTNVRHIDLLKKSIASISSAIEGFKNDLALELLDVDLQMSYEYLAEITGESIEDDVLDRIFSSFCVGK